MSTGMRKWMEKDRPDIPALPAEVSIGRDAAGFSVEMGTLLEWLK